MTEEEIVGQDAIPAPARRAGPRNRATEHRPQPLIADVTGGTPAAERGTRAPPGGEAQPAPALLIHELAEALTAIGNYLTALSLMLNPGAAPDETTAQEVVEKGLSQYSRAVEGLHRLRKSVS